MRTQPHPNPEGAIPKKVASSANVSNFGLQAILLYGLWASFKLLNHVHSPTLWLKLAQTK